MKLLSQQQEAIEHLQEWKVGALFMEAGTGKTRVACELVNCVKEIDLVLWVGPYQTINRKDDTSITSEINKWGGIKCENIIYIGIESLSQSDRIYLEIYKKVKEAKHAFIVVDESLKIKNITSKRTKRMLVLSSIAEYKLILNGTPFTKNILDIYSQMEFISPKILNMTLREYKDTFCYYTKITKKNSYGIKYTKEFITGFENIDYLYSLIKNYIYECDLNLNISQNYHKIQYNIDECMMEKYNDIKEYFLNEETLSFYNNNFFLSMTNKMQHAYCLANEKFELIKYIFKIYNIDPKETVIFCKYIDSAEECKKRYPEVIVLSYQKESLGLNLQNYHNTIYFDKIWDLALRVQSGRRTFRTGQKFDCKYFDLTGNVGLESMIDRNIEKKISQTEYFKRATKNQIMKEL